MLVAIEELQSTRKEILQACEKRLDGRNNGRAIVKNFSYSVDEFIISVWQNCARLINDDVDFMGSSNNDKPRYSGIDETLSQIEKLADLKDRGIITNEEFNNKKSVLLDKIQ